MKRLLAAFALFVTLPVAAATISGTVTAAATNTALSGMTVQAWDAGGILKGTASTDLSGHYNITVGPGSYRVLAFDPVGTYATSFYNNATSFDTATALTVQAATTAIDFSLVRGGVIAGTISGPDAAGLTGITVSVYNLDGSRRGFTTTDGSGHYRLVVPPGTFLIAAYDDAARYVTSFFPAGSTFPTAAPLAVNAGETTAADIRLLRGATVSGTITDRITGTAIAGARISIYAAGVLVTSATSDSLGHYRLLMAPGSYRVVIHDPAAIFAPEFSNRAGSFETSTIYTLAAGDEKTIDAQLVRAGFLAGTIIDASTTGPLQGITVAAFNADGTTRSFTSTDSSGAYKLVVPPGNYRVGAWDPLQIHLTRFAPGDRQFQSALPVSVLEAQTTTVNLALPRGTIVTGQVTTSSFATLANMTVAAYDHQGNVVSTTTDSTGRYRLLLESGPWRIVAFDAAFRFATVTRSIVAAGLEIVGEDFALVVGAHVSGVVTVASGAAIGRLTVAAYDANGAAIVTTTTRSDGSFDLTLPPGSYRFAAFDPLQHYQPSALTAAYDLNAAEAIGGIRLQVTSEALPRRRAARH
jgi:hypothetical protein